ncbi:MAG: PspC domain-containing protein [Streptomycetaceae bacterium]|nr:PspC domain-containing protein [Mycobacteriaceae bacterium]NUS57626.1 PspC domain-containing protein [Streptomycetaceae bacterium]
MFPDSAGRTVLPAADRLTRRSGGRVIGGVAGGVADHLGVDVVKVRATFVLLSALAGAGLMAYGMLWVFTPSGADTEPAPAPERRRAFGMALIGLALSAAVSMLFSGSAAQWMVPIVAVAIGVALVWREFDYQGARATLGMPLRPTVLTWTRVVLGATLIVAGLGTVVLAQVNLSSLGPALVAVAVTLIGVGLLTIPLWLRLIGALNAERSARIRNAEREEIASHLHDSVLQTLALIQRQADNAGEVARLARSQERELRSWLFSKPEEQNAGLGAALRALAGEVEDQHGVKVTPVVVGDVAVDDGSGFAREQFNALLGATREALVNAAKHAGVANIDLFAEAEPHQVSVFVRDRGSGFDEDEVPGDRHGLAKSIRGRVERRGGEVAVRSTPGRGTEIRIVMPRDGGERQNGMRHDVRGEVEVARDARGRAEAAHDEETG